MKIRIQSLFLVIILAMPVSLQAGGRDPYGNEDPNKKVIKQGVVGAATGAIAAEASGGKAGKGALIGAGTNVIGGALLDAVTAPPPPQTQVVYASPEGSSQPRKKIIRKFGPDGKVVSEEEVWE